VDGWKAGCKTSVGGSEDVSEGVEREESAGAEADLGGEEDLKRRARRGRPVEAGFSMAMWSVGCVSVWTVARTAEQNQQEHF
jgi:hypothetical protein